MHLPWKSSFEGYIIPDRQSIIQERIGARLSPQKIETLSNLRVCWLI